MRDGPLMRRRRLVVPLDHFRAVTLLEDQLLLGQEVVRERCVQFPNLVQLRQLGCGVISVVADQLTDPGPVLLLDMRTVVLVPRTRAGERDLVIGAVLEQVIVDELRAVITAMPMSALSESMPKMKKGKLAVAPLIAANTHFCALVRTDLVSVHPVAMSVISRVKQNSPEEFPPS